MVGGPLPLDPGHTACELDSLFYHCVAVRAAWDCALMSGPHTAFSNRKAHDTRVRPPRPSTPSLRSTD
jgi:hypothetical protein